MKKFFAAVLTAACILTMGVSAMASEAAPRGGGRGSGGGADAHHAPRHGMQQSGGIGLRGAGADLFWDADGNFLDRETVTANLDSAVANGEITPAERDLLLERYDLCAAIGGGAAGARRSLRGGEGVCRRINN